MFSRTTQKFFQVVPLVLLVFTTSQTVDAAQKGIRVYDKGLVENARFYEVICEDGKRASVRHIFDITELEEPPQSRGAGSRAIGSNTNMIKSVEICADTYAGKTKCQKNWTIDKAAKYVCKNK